MTSTRDDDDDDGDRAPPSPRRPFDEAPRLTVTFSARPLKLPSSGAASPESLEDLASSVPAPLGGRVAAVPAPLSLPQSPEGPPTLELVVPEAVHDGWVNERGAPQNPFDHERATDVDLANIDEAFGLVEQSAPSRKPVSVEAEMAERFALSDFTGALRLAELVLGRKPRDPQANAIETASRERLVEHYSARLGGPFAKLEVAVARGMLAWLGVDPRALRLVEHFDGNTTLAEILGGSSLPRLDTLKLLIELADAGAIRSK
jgi:hypothetical protein